MSTVTNFLVSSLPAYVQENRDLLIKNFALVGTETRKRIALQTGIKGTARLHDLAAAIVLQDGSVCGFNPLDSLTITKRDITVKVIKHDGEVCPETLLGKYGEWLVRIKASEHELPFEEYIVRVMTDEINKVIEKLIWQGDDSVSNTDPNTNQIDGFLVKFLADSDVIDVSIASGTSAYAGLLSVYAALPEEVLDRGGMIFVAPSIYRAFLMDIVNLNLYHYAGPEDAAPEEFVLPGTDVRVAKTPGLAGTLYAVGTFADNLVYGCDGENDEEDIEIVYNPYTKKFQFTARFAAGVAYRYPDMVVLGEFAAAPSFAAAGSALAAIAANTANIKDYSTVLGNVKTDLDTIATKSAGLDNLAGIKTDTGAIADADHVFKTKEQA